MDNHRGRYFRGEDPVALNGLEVVANPANAPWPTPVRPPTGRRCKALLQAPLHDAEPGEARLKRTCRPARRGVATRMQRQCRFLSACRSRS